MKRIYFLLVFLLPVYFIYAQTAVMPIAGDGSEESPYEISSLENLYWMAEDPSRWAWHYLQVADIDASTTTEWFGGQGWLPVAGGESGNESVRFTGAYNGQGFVIDGLFINRPEMSSVGLFGTIHDAFLQNIFLTNVNITGDRFTAALVGSNLGTVYNCFSSGMLNGGKYVGGLIGSNYNALLHSGSDVNVTGDTIVGGLAGWNPGFIKGSFARGNVQGYATVGGLLGESLAGEIIASMAEGDVFATFGSVGGLVGYLYGSVYESYATGNVSGNSGTGGLVGSAYLGSIYQSFARGNVENTQSRAGGLVASIALNSFIFNSYATGAVNGVEAVGGLAGNLTHNPAISRSFSKGAVSATNSSVGGLIGQAAPGYYILLCYWDTETSGQASGDLGSPRNTEQMTYPYADNTYLGWNFDTIWAADPNYEINQGYPFLQWQLVALEPPANLEATGGFSGVKLQWEIERENNPHAYLLGYNIFRNGVQVNDQLYTRQEFTDFDVVNFQTYTYHVTAVYIQGESDASESIQVTPGLHSEIPSEGDGTAANPYHISSVGNMLWIAEDPGRWDLHYIQVQDMDYFLLKNKDNNQGWLPIGNNDTPFTGSFNGQNYTINGLYINRPDNDFVGLFGYTKNAVLQNIRLTNVEIHGNTLVGGLVGASGSMVGENSGSIVNCHVSGNITGNNKLGGLVGECFDPVTGSSANINIIGTGMWMGGLIGYARENVVNCTASGSITANSSSWSVGGLIGEIHDINIQDCSASVNVFGGAYLGGLIGTGGGTIVNCHATGNVTGTVNYSWNVGGLIGQNFAHVISSSASGIVKGDGYTGGLAGTNNGFIDRSFATGSVKGEWEYSHGTGGLAGFNHAQGKIENSFARGSVSGQEDVGGFVGENAGLIEYAYSTGFIVGTENYGGFCGNNSGNINSSYWDTETSGQQTSDGATGRNTAEMTHPYNENTYVGWDFENIWLADEDYEINNGYPFLYFSTETEYYELLLEVSPEGGGTVTGEGMYEAGQQINISASPSDNYVFLRWAGDTEHLDDEWSHQTSVIMPAFDITIRADFELMSALEYTEELILKVYPNPAYSHVYISFFNSTAAETRIALLSITGQLQAEHFYSGKGEITDKIDVRGLHPGIYLIGIYSNGINKVQKLVIGKE